MQKKAFLLLLIVSKLNALELNLSPRYDVISGNNIQFNRTLLQSDLSMQNDKFRFFIDGFAEYDFAPEENKRWRRIKNTAYLQELYGEYTTKNFFIKLGRQANRWSDSWILPSLDVWTARRFERLFVDPLPFQLTHSTGLTLSLVNTSWSIDLAAMYDVPFNTLPEPYPVQDQIREPEAINPGVRTKFSLGGLQTSLVAARSHRQNTFGISSNYAFEKFVPKVELGGTINEQKETNIVSRRMAFSSFGVDIFLDSWTFTPQFTGYSNEDLSSDDSSNFLVYFSANYTNGKHEFQWQNYTNRDSTNVFFGTTYSYAINKNWSISALVQKYQGDSLNLTAVTESNTGGVLTGLGIKFMETLRKRK